MSQLNVALAQCRRALTADNLKHLDFLSVSRDNLNAILAAYDEKVDEALSLHAEVIELRRERSKDLLG